MSDAPTSPAVRNAGATCSFLQCEWRSWVVVRPGVLRLDVAAGQCPDMKATIWLAGLLMPNVHVIHTSTDGIPATAYRCVDGEWRAFVPAQPSNASVDKKESKTCA